jgi:hypothetical protein
MSELIPRTLEQDTTPERFYWDGIKYLPIADLLNLRHK